MTNIQNNSSNYKSVMNEKLIGNVTVREILKCTTQKGDFKGHAVMFFSKLVNFLKSGGIWLNEENVKTELLKLTHDPAKMEIISAISTKIMTIAENLESQESGIDNNVSDITREKIEKRVGKTQKLIEKMKIVYDEAAPTVASPASKETSPALNIELARKQLEKVKYANTLKQLDPYKILQGMKNGHPLTEAFAAFLIEKHNLYSPTTNISHDNIQELYKEFVKDVTDFNPDDTANPNIQEMYQKLQVALQSENYSDFRKSQESSKTDSAKIFRTAITEIGLTNAAQNWTLSTTDKIQAGTDQLIADTKKLREKNEKVFAIKQELVTVRAELQTKTTRMLNLELEEKTDSAEYQILSRETGALVIKEAELLKKLPKTEQPI